MKKLLVIIACVVMSVSFLEAREFRMFPDDKFEQNQVEEGFSRLLNFAKDSGDIVLVRVAEELIWKARNFDKVDFEVFTKGDYCHFYDYLVARYGTRRANEFLKHFEKLWVWREKNNVSDEIWGKKCGFLERYAVDIVNQIN